MFKLKTKKQVFVFLMILLGIFLYRLYIANSFENKRINLVNEIEQQIGKELERRGFHVEYSGNKSIGTSIVGQTSTIESTKPIKVEVIENILIDSGLFGLRTKNIYKISYTYKKRVNFSLDVGASIETDENNTHKILVSYRAYNSDLEKCLTIIFYFFLFYGFLNENVIRKYFKNELEVDNTPNILHKIFGESITLYSEKHLLK